MSHQKGFSLVQILLVIVALGLIGGTGWYVWQSKNKTAQTLDKAASASGEPAKTDKKTAPASDPTANWTTYSSTKGVYSFRYPASWVIADQLELCTEGLVLLGGNSSSVGTCASEDGGQMNISSTEGTHDDEYALSASEFTDIKKTILTVDGVQGSRSEGITKAPSPDQVVGGYPEGTKVVQYVFAGKNNRTYVARYVQLSSYPDVLSDFELLVTKTLKFSV